MSVRVLYLKLQVVMCCDVNRFCRTEDVRMCSVCVSFVGCMCVIWSVYAVISLKEVSDGM